MSDHGGDETGKIAQKQDIRDTAFIDAASRSLYLAAFLEEPLAQSVEQLTFNQRVAGSIPARLTRIEPRHPQRADQANRALVTR